MAESGQPRAVLSGPVSIGNATHDVILNVLDSPSNTTIGTPDGPKPISIYFNRDAFEPTVKDWNGVPVVFAREHPDPDAYDSNPDAELRRVNGEIVGKVGGANISLIGNPKLMGALKLRKDDGLETLINTGKVSISTGFRASYDESGKLTAPIKPHHVLMFVRDGGAVPGDKGATILNGPAPEPDITDTEAVGLLDRIKNWFMRRKPEPQPAPDEGEPVSIGNAYPSEHAARIVEPGEFEPDSFRRKSVADGISLILGKKKGKTAMEAQAYRFDKTKFTVAEAKKWLADHDITVHKFEPAAEPVGNQTMEIDPMDEKTIKELESKVAAAEKAATEANEKLVALGNAVKAKDDELAKMAEKVAAADKVIADQEAARKEAAWLAFKVNLPKGMVHGDAEAKTRAEFEKDPASVATRALTFQAQAPPVTGQPSGDPNATAPTMRKISTIGVYNHMTRKYEDVEVPIKQ